MPRDGMSATDVISTPPVIPSFRIDSRTSLCSILSTLSTSSVFE